MTRQYFEKKLVLASHNPGKVREIAEFFEPLHVSVFSASDYNLEEPAETGATFTQNARLKAAAAAEVTGLPALADDSGLVVPALGGRPGIRSARWAGPDRDFNDAMLRIHEMLEGHPDNSAHFVCVLALCWPDAHCECFEGIIEGSLAWPPRGNKGFGYDPMFVPEGHVITFGEMAPEKKHKISHRAVAFRKLIEACFVG